MWQSCLCPLRAPCLGKLRFCWPSNAAAAIFSVEEGHPTPLPPLVSASSFSLAHRLTPKPPFLASPCAIQRRRRNLYLSCHSTLSLFLFLQLDPSPPHSIQYRCHPACVPGLSVEVARTRRGASAGAEVADTQLR